MKQTIIAVICFLCVSSLYIQAQKINHPSLLYTPQRIQQVKQRMQHEPKLQEAWGDIKKTADEALQKKDFNRLDYLSLAYLMTDNKEYADAIKEILLKAVEALHGAYGGCSRSFSGGACGREGKCESIGGRRGIFPGGSV